ncbi:MAG: hypothetical protein JSW46_03235 [Gemmatimonadota bacterium]|nr:MAG: hypothetical protein JSW46_03235 [Gemmatimonadota bacterium]
MIQKEIDRAERGTFHAAYDLGIWDILIASFLSMFAFAPLLSVSMGDFWAAAVFVPIVGAVYLTLLLVKRRLLVPRIGVVRLGPYRQARLRRLSVALLIVNVVALAAGTFFAVRFEAVGGLAPVIFLSFILLVGFSLAAYSLDIPRFFLYGLVLAVGPFIGEWLWRKGYASHHGWPVVFGTAAALMVAVGLIKLIAVVRGHAPLGDGPLAGEDR